MLHSFCRLRLDHAGAILVQSRLDSPNVARPASNRRAFRFERGDVVGEVSGGEEGQNDARVVDDAVELLRRDESFVLDGKDALVVCQIVQLARGSSPKASTLTFDLDRSQSCTLRSQRSARDYRGTWRKEEGSVATYAIEATQSRRDSQVCRSASSSPVCRRLSAMGERTCEGGRTGSSRKIRLFVCPTQFCFSCRSLARS